jgi:hypothetical protein
MAGNSIRALLLGGCLFLLAVVFLFLWMEGGWGRGLGLGLAALSLSAVSLMLGARWRVRSRSPLDTRRDQRLWRSGPLGRQWLKIRRRLR